MSPYILRQEITKINLLYKYIKWILIILVIKDNYLSDNPIVLVTGIFSFICINIIDVEVIYKHYWRRSNSR